jgi:hypothetical protein
MFWALKAHHLEGSCNNTGIMSMYMVYCELSMSEYAGIAKKLF